MMATGEERPPSPPAALKGEGGVRSRRNVENAITAGALPYHETFQQSPWQVASRPATWGGAHFFFRDSSYSLMYFSGSSLKASRQPVQQT